MTDDFYDLLDVPPDATQEEIKEAFRTQVRIYHPDLNDDDRAQAQFTVLKKAYDILGDPVERQAYDRLGHAAYVSKRTSGLPSADLWRREPTDEDDAVTDRSTSTSTSTSERAGTDSRTTEATSSQSRSSATRDASSAGASSSRDTASEAHAAGATGTATSSRTATGTSTSSRTATGTATGDGRATRTASTATSERRSSSAGGRTSLEAFVQWWHGKNFAWPLIWLAALTYLTGLVHFGLENAASLRTLGAELAAVGVAPAAIWAVLSESRYGIDVPAEFVATAEPVALPLSPLAWYVVLAGAVATSLLLVLSARLLWRRDTWGPITFDETIVIALALGATSFAGGGPLLTGIVLLPLLFGVIVYRTRQLPGWAPSYGYVVAVCAPLVALVAGVVGYASLPTDLVAFVVLPLAGAFGLPIRVQVRKRVGR
ncbi:J domain-containing protein [Natronobeatus ordinarius]|uniref:J domain-containing protein n=1 Tax=Natronobeatus ordinarius TaxID=2963433 RepID=UPI0020CCDC84|nr:J domain-containing protein [Natronobeatus ordinarius]